MSAPEPESSARGFVPRVLPVLALALFGLAQILAFRDYIELGVLKHEDTPLSHALTSGAFFLMAMYSKRTEAAPVHAMFLFLSVLSGAFALQAVAGKLFG